MEKNKVRACPHSVVRECCAYCPNTKYRENANKICSEIMSCTDFYRDIVSENIYLKEQLELEHWRLAQLKKIFESEDKQELYKIVMSYADEYSVEVENKRFKVVRRQENRIAKQADNICSPIKEALSKNPQPSGEAMSYDFVDADGKKQTVIVAKEMAKQLIALDEKMEKANEREKAHIADFGMDPFNSKMKNWTERKIGSIYGYGDVGGDARKKISEMRETYSENFSRYWKGIVRNFIRNEMQNKNMADCYYFYTFEYMSKVEIAAMLKISDSLVSRYLKEMQLFAEEMGYNKLYPDGELRLSYDKAMEKLKRIYENT